MNCCPSGRKHKQPKFHRWGGWTLTKEIRIRDDGGAFRVIYVAKLVDAIYVLHCFQKKTEKTAKTAKTDLDLAAKRYRDLLKEQGQ